MLKKLIETKNDILPLILRLTLALVMFPHGAQKLFGWFGGYGLSATMKSFTEGMGIPAALAFLVILAESVGAVALAAGLLSRASAFGIAMVMAGAALLVHLPYGFFMNWAGSQQGEGIEYHLLAIGVALAIMIRGGGQLSLDYLLQQKFHHAGDARLSA